MNPKAQPELHPGADLLSAFAEHALPDPERARLLAHMAVCARCREVVYLAQAAADPEPVPAHSGTTAASPGWIRAAFAKWRAVLVPAAALAAVAAIVLWVQTHPISRPTETAQIVAPPQPSSSAATARMAPAPATPMASAPPSDAETRRPASSTAKRATPRSNGMNSVVLPGLAGAGSFGPNQSGLSLPMADQRFHGGIHLDAHSAAMARFAPLPQPVRPSNWVSRSSQGGPEWQNNQQMADLAPGLNPQAPVPSQAPATGSVFSVSDQLAAPVAFDSAPVLQSSQQVERSPRSTNGFALLQLARRAPLPSGRNAVSSAALLNRLLVIDSAGSVFLSQDAGKHWETVAAQWSGKAIEVQAPPEHLFLRTVATPGPRGTAPGAAQAPPASASSEVDASSNAPLPSADSSPTLAFGNITHKEVSPPPPMLFTLVTDRHQTWVSADGKVWSEPSAGPYPSGRP